MRVLQYKDLDLRRVRAAFAFDKVRAAIEAGDFRSADVKKLHAGPYWRGVLRKSLSRQARALPGWWQDGIDIKNAPSITALMGGSKSRLPASVLPFGCAGNHEVMRACRRAKNHALISH